MTVLRSLALFLLLALSSCASSRAEAGTVRVVHLGREPSAEFAELRAAFASANPGYDVQWHPDCRELSSSDTNRVVFVQGPAGREMAPTLGDLLLLPPGEGWMATDGRALDLLAFAVPHEFPPGLPATIRPDWDPRITDTPGGCAEDQDAYRRILLTWLEQKGPYVLHALNAHRVRLDDSFSHYHPLEGGFDELYLVQGATPGARVLTSEQVSAIEAEDVAREDMARLVTSHALQVGDLVYLPRGTMHRGLGGALVQVISVPGFVPNSEVGLDHHLRALNEYHGLEGSDLALPFHAAASREAVVK